MGCRAESFVEWAPSCGTPFPETPGGNFWGAIPQTPVRVIASGLTATEASVTLFDSGAVPFSRMPIHHHR